MPDTTIAAYTRAFEPGDLAPVVALWNRCLSQDPITEERFWHQFLLDPNFDTDGARIAYTEEDTIAGFLQAIVRRESYGSLGLQENEGWLTAFFVAPEYRRQGIGTRLLNDGMAFLREHKRKRVSCNGYAPFYQFPGVDIVYPEAQLFLRARGFVPTAEAVAMEISLEGVQVPPTIHARYAALRQEGYTVRPFRRGDTLPLLTFTEQHFPHWTPILRDSLQHGSEDIVIAAFHGSVIGYAQWENSHTDPPNGAPGRFGPFGVHPDVRGKGIGAILFWTLVEGVAEKGAQRLWFGWAGGQNVAFYERAGCRITRRFELYANRI